MMFSFSYDLSFDEQIRRQVFYSAMDKIPELKTQTFASL